MKKRRSPGNNELSKRNIFLASPVDSTLSSSPGKRAY